MFTLQKPDNGETIPSSCALRSEASKLCKQSKLLQKQSDILREQNVAVSLQTIEIANKWRNILWRL